MFNKATSLLAACLLVAPGLIHAAATIVIVNNDGAGVGFNDPTIVAPIGGNPGTTLGQQRLNAFQAAANKWGATLTSVPVVNIRAQWTALTCTSTGAVLGSAGSIQIFRDFAGAPKAGTWYGGALANAINGTDLDATPEINANFNVNLGKPGCLDGIFFYLGTDNNHGNNVDLVTVLEHEFGHGLGFQTFTNGSTGVFQSAFPSIADWYLMDNSNGLLWKDMTNAQRAASAISVNHLVWSGPNVTAAVPNVLTGTPRLTVTAPASVAADYAVGTASFGTALKSPGVTAEVMPVVDTAPSLGLACTPLSALNAAAVNGKIAIVDRGTCTFNVKAANVQAAGAVGMVMVNNVAGPAPGLGGTDPTITIPCAGLSQADGNTLKAAIATRTRTHSGMFANLGANAAPLAGADGSNRALMYAPNPFESGSSVSHFDKTAYPNQLMEPAINADLTHEVAPPKDMTYTLLKDLGWQ